MEAPEFDSSEPPPPNRAQGCFGVLLWFMPAVFAVATYWGIWAVGFGREGNPAIVAWIVLNLCFIVMAGWFNAMMSHRIRLLEPGKRDRKIAGSIVFFFLLQLGLIPVILAVTVFSFCAFAGPLIG